MISYLNCLLRVELSSLKSIYLNLPKGLHVPMMVAIDFKGFKLLAVSLLPVGKTTLVYGRVFHLSKSFFLLTICYNRIQ